MGEFVFKEENPDPKTIVLRFSGEFEGLSAVGARSRLIHIVQEAAGKSVLIDLAEISYIDSAAIGVLIEISKAGAEKKVKLILTNVSDAVQKVLTITNVHKLFTIIGC